MHAGGRRVTTTHVALCTNGFVDHRIEDAAGSPVFLAPISRSQASRLHDRLRRGSEASAGSDELRPQRDDRRRHAVRVRHATQLRPGCRRRDLDVHGRPGVGSLTSPTYHADAPVPGEVLQAMDDEVRPFAQPRRPAGQPFEFHWHGLMAYNDSLIRVVGPHPRHPRLLYNLGCNGVGFLPSIHGGHSSARISPGTRRRPAFSTRGDRFQRPAAQITRLAGLDPVVDESGDSRRYGDTRSRDRGVRLRCGAWTRRSASVDSGRATAHSRLWQASISRSRQERFSPFSGRTVRARPRPSRSWRGPERTGGEVTVLGADPARAGGDWRDRIGVVLQESGRRSPA